jgi:hypothetical protein
MPAMNDERLLERLVGHLSALPGLRALVLGGSRALGTATEHSDYDLGLYYEPGAPFDAGRLGEIAALLDDRGTEARVTAIGEWGPWINGGAWLLVEGRRVDLLYRDLDRVRAVIDACRAGRIERHYQPGHPHAFVSAIYAGETAHCRPLWDPEGAISTLKGLTAPYPDALAEALIRSFLFESGFALENARKGLDRRDVNYLVGCCFRPVACLCQVLFAINRTYLLNEKGAVAAAEALARRPSNLGRRVAAGYHEIAAGSADDGLAVFEALVAETAELVP